MIKALNAVQATAKFSDGVKSFVQVFGQDLDSGEVYYWSKTRGSWAKYVSPKAVQAEQAEEEPVIEIEA